MPFDPKSPKKAEKNPKEVLQKKRDLPLQKRWKCTIKKVLDDLLINQEKLMKTERVNLSNYIFPKTKSVRDKFTLEKLK
jgi:hypothetical protein